VPFKHTEKTFFNNSYKENDCLIYKGGKDKDGYGKIFYNKKHWRAHRLSFYLINGFSPEFVCHKCDTPACINPKHLFAGNAKINNLDRAKKGRSARLSNEMHPGCKYTDELVSSIRSMRVNGLLLKDISIKTGVGVSYVSQLCGGGIRNA